MDERRGSPDDRDVARRYQIRLKGHLDTPWADRLGEMSLTHTSDGTTVLAGPVADLAALHGLLQRLRDLGVTLLSISEDTDTPTAPVSTAGDPTTRRPT